MLQLPCLHSCLLLLVVGLYRTTLPACSERYQVPSLLVSLHLLCLRWSHLSLHPALQLLVWWIPLVLLCLRQLVHCSITWLVWSLLWFLLAQPGRMAQL